MRVHVLSFGVLKDWLGASSAMVEVPEGATVAALLELLTANQRANEAARRPANQFVRLLRGIAVSVNAEYATASQVLSDGDEVGLLPPVSGGAPDDPEQEASGSVVIALTRETIDAEKLVGAAKRGEDGAVLVFDGIVRNNSHGRQTLYLDYEAYEEMAAKQMAELARGALDRFGVRHVTMVHRLGKLEVGETSVLIVVASTHRGQGYEASRWLIDTLKQTVPIWKKEVFVDGAVWAAGDPFPAGIAVGPPDAE